MYSMRIKHSFKGHFGGGRGMETLHMVDLESDAVPQGPGGGAQDPFCIQCGKTVYLRSVVESGDVKLCVTCNDCWIHGACQQAWLITSHGAEDLPDQGSSIEGFKCPKCDSTGTKLSISFRQMPGTGIHKAIGFLESIAFREFHPAIGITIIYVLAVAYLSLGLIEAIVSLSIYWSIVLFIFTLIFRLPALWTYPLAIHRCPLLIMGYMISMAFLEAILCIVRLNTITKDYGLQFVKFLMDLGLLYLTAIAVYGVSTRWIKFRNAQISAAADIERGK